MHHLNMLAQEKSLIEITAEPLAVRDVPQMLLVHGRVAMRNQKPVIKLPVHRGENDDVSNERRGKPPWDRVAIRWPLKFWLTAAPREWQQEVNQPSSERQRHHIVNDRRQDRRCICEVPAANEQQNSR